MTIVGGLDGEWILAAMERFDVARNPDMGPERLGLVEGVLGQRLAPDNRRRPRRGLRMLHIQPLQAE
jgi:hypothetical protein